MKISDQAFQQKIKFNPEPKKQAQGVVFRRNINKIDHPSLYFNQNLVKLPSTHKHLGMVLDTKLDFSQVNKTIGLLLKFQNTLPGASLITIFKSFIKPHLDHGDRINGSVNNTLFHQNIESYQ